MSGALPGWGQGMKFDWYQATVAEDPGVLVGELMQRLAPDGRIEEGPGRHNYHQSFTLKRADGNRAALILCGGPNGNPNATASGDGCEDFVTVLREGWPEHRVTRVDSCEDFTGEGAYDRLEGVCRAITAGEGIKGRAIVPDALEDGRTYYMGAATSDVRARLYDKAAEVRRHVAPAVLLSIPSHWARLEVQVRPRKEWKGAVAHLAAEQVWGFSTWTGRLAVEALALDVERLAMRVGREPSEERALRFMLRQYGGSLERLHAAEGSWARVGVALGERLEKYRAFDKRVGGERK